MKTYPNPLDYGIYIDHRKAFIVSINEFNPDQPTLVRVELNIDAEGEKPGVEPTKEERKALVEEMQMFSNQVFDQLESPHRVIIFGPSEDKYELHKAMQREDCFEQVIKEIQVTEPMELPLAAQQFAEKYFAVHPSF